MDRKTEETGAASDKTKIRNEDVSFSFDNTIVTQQTELRGGISIFNDKQSPIRRNTPIATAALLQSQAKSCQSPTGNYIDISPSEKN